MFRSIRFPLVCALALAAAPVAAQQTMDHSTHGQMPAMPMTPGTMTPGSGQMPSGTMPMQMPMTPGTMTPGAMHGAMHGTPAPAATNAAPSTVAYEAAMARMHTGMAIAYTGNADVDFVAGMIPHHQGAIDMAEVVLKYGSDPEVKKLAEAVISAQTQEIAWMQAWLAKNAPAKP